MDMEIPMTEASNVAAAARMRCSFCNRSQDEVKKLVAGPGVLICDGCVQLCVEVIANTPDPEPTAIVTPQTMPTEDLLRMLASYETGFGRIDSAMGEIVEVLRGREVSWSAIAEALGVTRQAAWKRFA